MADDGSRKSGSKVGGNKGILRLRRENRALDASLRNSAHAQRTPMEQLKLIEQRPGESARERARIGKMFRDAANEIV